VLLDNPLAYWRLGDAPGSTEAADLMGMFGAGLIDPMSTGNLVLGVPSLLVETTDDALRVHNGADPLATYLDAGDVLDFPGNAPFTLEAWVRPTDISFGVIISKRRYERDGVGGAGNLAPGYMLWYDDAPNRFYFERVDSDVSDVAQADFGGVALHHVVATYDDQTTTMYLYVNGVLIEQQVSTRQLANNPTELRIGSRMRDVVLDEVAVYPTALSLARVQAHYAAGTGL
jgi:hypothetical protein